jgi:hypothetical protein
MNDSMSVIQRTLLKWLSYCKMQSKGCQARSANHHPKGLIMLTDDQCFFFHFCHGWLSPCKCSTGGNDLTNDLALMATSLDKIVKTVKT